MRTIIAVLCLFVAGCGASTITKIPVESIYINGGGYKFLVRDSDGVMKFQDYLASSNLIIKDDVSDDEKSWVKVQDGFQDLVLEIHVQNVDELQGG